MIKKWHLASIVGAIALTCTQSALAHRTWLLPSMGVADDKGAWVTFDAAVSEDLFVFGANAVKLEGLSIQAPDGSSLPAQNASTGRLRSSFDLQLSQEGTYRVSLVNESAMASYKLGTEVKRWRGAVDAIAKEVPKDAQELRVTITQARLETFVTAGRGSEGALRPAGKGLEVLPVTHPEHYAPGDVARFRALLDGKPLTGLTVAVVPGGVRYRGVLREQAFTTDAKGEFSVKWPEAGMYAINASYPPRPTQPPAAEPGETTTRRFTYTSTLEVLPQ